MSKSTVTAAPSAPARRRAPVKALNKSAAEIAANAATEKARKAASRKALHAADKPVDKPVDKAAADKPVDKPVDKAAADHAAYLEALRVDAAALGVDPDAYIAEQLKPVRTKYAGPMLALRSAAKTYVKASNGYPCCGDDLSNLCGGSSREVTVKALILALGLPGNPYAHLNPGQQSMNLRNRARAQIKTGALALSTVAAAFAQVVA